MDIHTTPQWQSIKDGIKDHAPGPERVRQIVDQLRVETALRYRPGKGVTWCNIFTTDVVEALGFLPTHWMDKDGTGSAPQGKGIEMSANRIVRWLNGEGPNHGWVTADRTTAVDAAARGHLVVVGWDSGGSGPGHVAILLPEGTIAQAGSRNFVGETVEQGFGHRPVTYFVQVGGGAHKP